MKRLYSDNMPINRIRKILPKTLCRTIIKIISEDSSIVSRSIMEFFDSEKKNDCSE